jgi:hypothetical protein
LAGDGMSSKPHRPRNPPAQHVARLLAILRANLAQATEPDLRERLLRAIEALKKRNAA